MAKSQEKRYELLTEINRLESELTKDNNKNDTQKKMTDLEKQEKITNLKKLSDELSASLLAASRECSKSKTGTTMVDAVVEAYINKKG